MFFVFCDIWYNFPRLLLWCSTTFVMVVLTTLKFLRSLTISERHDDLPWESLGADVVHIGHVLLLSHCADATDVGWDFALEKVNKVSVVIEGNHGSKRDPFLRRQ